MRPTIDPTAKTSRPPSPESLAAIVRGQLTVQAFPDSVQHLNRLLRFIHGKSIFDPSQPLPDAGQVNLVGYEPHTSVAKQDVDAT